MYRNTAADVGEMMRFLLQFLPVIFLPSRCTILMKGFIEPHPSPNCFHFSLFSLENNNAFSENKLHPANGVLMNFLLLSSRLLSSRWCWYVDACWIFWSEPANLVSFSASPSTTERPSSPIPPEAGSSTTCCSAPSMRMENQRWVGETLLFKLMNVYPWHVYILYNLSTE